MAIYLSINESTNKTKRFQVFLRVADYSLVNHKSDCHHLYEISKNHYKYLREALIKELYEQVSDVVPPSLLKTDLSVKL